MSGEAPKAPDAKPSEHTLPEPDAETGGEGYRVVLFNDDVHSMEQVVVQLMIATGCDVTTATHIMYRAHSNGQATVTITTEPQAERIAGILREISLRVEVRPVG